MSSLRDVLLETLPSVSGRGVLQDGSIGGIILWTRVVSKYKQFLAFVESVCGCVFRRQFHTYYRRVRHREVRHRLLTSLPCFDH